MPTYEEHIHSGLSKAYGKARYFPPLDINDLKMVLFSDHHRGQNDGADDFKPCKAIYHAAVTHYLENGFSLCLLGDVEELWECRPANTIRAYHDTLLLEQKFTLANRYDRLWGNHDDEWFYQSRVNKFLKSYISRPAQQATVPEGLRIPISNGGVKIGELLLVHGHQGTLESDRYAWLSRLAVRYLWRPFQRLTGIKSTTPSRDFKLRLKHELAMHAWASEQNRLLLITGHTHHPVFSSLSHEARLKNEIEKLKLQLVETVVPQRKIELEMAIDEKNSLLNKKLAEYNGIMLDIPADRKPCYFNTGCCSFSDGDITALEIEEGKIRLVRWPDDQGKAHPKILEKGDLIEIFGQCE
jgi:UDP-2,3-diacylglucosamine pyrophosphatase LpxH